MSFRVFRPNDVQALGRMCLAALVLAVFAAISAPAAVAQTYAIRPGDILRIEVLEDASLNRSVLVAPDGRISIPTVGNIRASGQTIESIQRVVTQRLAGNFASAPNVYVSLESLYVPTPAFPEVPKIPDVISVYVVGEANKAGRHEVLKGTNVLQLFSVMGGFTNFAATKRIQLRRVDPKTQTQTIRNFNYKAIVSGRQGGLTVLREGDTIVVPQRRLFE